MNRLIFSTWLISAILHSLVLLPLVVISGKGTSQVYDEGTGQDAYKLEKGLSVDMVSFGDAAEHYEVAALTSPVIEEKLLEPDLKDAITAIESPMETARLTNEPTPPEPRTPETVEIITQKSAGEAQDGGKATLLSAYVGKIHGALQKVKLDRRVKGAGQVVVGFRVDESGHVKSREVLQSSGIAAIDQAAFEMLDKASFPPPPGALGGDELYKVPFTFSSKPG